MNAVESANMSLASLAGLGESCQAEGVYTFKCLEVIPERKSEYDALFQKMLANIQNNIDVSELEAELATFPMQEIWEDTIDNVVCTVGKNLMLQTALTGSAYTVTGPYMGLISSVGYTAVAAADTMSSHAGWTEAGSTNAPTFAARVAPSFGTASAGAISTSTPVSFTMTGAGTLVGAFITYGTGAVTTLMNTGGTLLSAGAFTGGNQPVNSGNVVQVTYSLSL